MVALIGAYFLTCGLIIFIDPTYSSKPAPAWHYFLFGVIDLAGGLCVIRGVRCIVKFAYPDEGADSDSKHDA